MLKNRWARLLLAAALLAAAYWLGAFSAGFDNSFWGTAGARRQAPPPRPSGGR